VARSPLRSESALSSPSPGALESASGFESALGSASSETSSLSEASPSRVPPLPLLISVPHAGLEVPPEAQPFCALTQQEIIEDGDEGAAEIYAGLREDVAAFVTTPVARAILDMNRAEDDRRADGVVKTHTCWNVPVYGTTLPEDAVERLLDRYHRPYHGALTREAAGSIRLGVDCHTMAAVGPPIGPGAGVERPWICLSNGGEAGGGAIGGAAVDRGSKRTCPDDWLLMLADCFRDAFQHDVAVNDPFRGGYIVRSHAAELPWVQLELSRANFIPNPEKAQRVRAALHAWCQKMA
jgi:N-formylglutamate deformylase